LISNLSQHDKPNLTADLRGCRRIRAIYHDIVFAENATATDNQSGQGRTEVAQQIPLHWGASSSALLAVAKLFLAQNVLTVSLAYPQGAGVLTGYYRIGNFPLVTSNSLAVRLSS
jgi:hypothetical protein